MGMQYQGKSVTEAQNMAAMSVKGKVQVQGAMTIRTVSMMQTQVDMKR